MFHESSQGNLFKSGYWATPEDKYAVPIAHVHAAFNGRCSGKEAMAQMAYHTLRTLWQWKP